MPANARNWFGLPYVSALFVYHHYGNNPGLMSTVLNAGGTITLSGEDIYGPMGNAYQNVYPETAQPQFQTVEYDFWNPTTVFNQASQTWTNTPLPGRLAFSTANTSPLFVAGVGAQIQIAGYAKLGIQNGYAGVYGYLGQYFDKAYKMTNGVATTNTTGVLSPYGNFFATEPGPSALVTMPDIDTGERGTGIVHCVSLNVDKNHDGNMDLSFNGPDATSQASPMIAWVNNGHCVADSSGGLDRDLVVPPAMPNYAAGQITCQRDLENFFRLWVCGLPSLTNGNYQVTLNWNVVSGSPAINLYESVETNGGTAYLTDTNMAFLQCLATAHGSSPYNIYFSGPGAALAKITTNAPFTFSANYFTNNAARYYLFEGAGIGSGELMLTITDANSNAVVQTGLWLDLHDVRDFFEQDVVRDSTSGAKSNWTSYVETVLPAVTSGLGNDTNMIVLVHGINVRPWDCVNDAETVCKRLYWAGYQGKFTSVEWPCNLLTPIPSPLSPAVFNDSELQGYKASGALTTCLNGLKTRFPNYRLNILAHSQGNTVVSEAIKNGAPFDTYILTQGALPDSAYDVNAPVDTDLTSQEHGEYITPESQPMGYRGVYTNSNFAGRVVNFYNPQDGVLDAWVKDQKLLKPTSYFSTAHYYFNGTDSYFYPALADPYLVTDPEESRADVSRSRTLSIGQSGPASAHGVIKSAVDLNADFGFNDATAEHSAQWTRPIQTSRPYFQQVLISCQIQPAP